MDSSAPASPEATGPGRGPAGGGSHPREPGATLVPSGSSGAGRRVPGRARSVLLLARADLGAIAGSWLARGFLIASALLSVLMLKGMQAEQKPAGEMLEALYVMYVVVWMHGVIFIAGGALAREQDCLNDAILSRGLTRGEYMGGKLLARGLAVLLLVGGVLVPASFWAVRQDQLVRAESGQVVSKVTNARIEAWEPRKVFAGTDGTVTEVRPVVGDPVASGDVLVVFDDRQLFDQLEVERRAEETARNEVANAQRRHEDAQRTVAQVEDALARAERALMARDLMSRIEQADRETEVRSRKRDLQTAENQVRITQDAITAAERSVENTQARVREARKRLAQATVTAPLSGYVTERQVQPAQHVGLGTHLLTIARLDEFEIRLPVYDFEEFKRLQTGLVAYITLGRSSFTGAVERLGATTQNDRWGRACNYAHVRFRGDGTPGLLGRDADVRVTLPPREERPGQVAALYNSLTGKGQDDLESRGTSVRMLWMAVGLGRVLGCACLLVALTLFLLVVSRSLLIAILGATALWHVSNLLFDFAGLPELSYLELVRTMDKVLAGALPLAGELIALAWLYGLAAALGAAALALFISRDPPK